MTIIIIARAKTDYLPELQPPNKLLFVDTYRHTENSQHAHCPPYEKSSNKG